MATYLKYEKCNKMVFISTYFIFQHKLRLQSFLNFKPYVRITCFSQSLPLCLHFPINEFLSVFHHITVATLCFRSQTINRSLVARAKAFRHTVAEPLVFDKLFRVGAVWELIRFQCSSNCWLQTLYYARPNQAKLITSQKVNIVEQRCLEDFSSGLNFSVTTCALSCLSLTLRL
jgi:hypothetical protein